MDIDVKLPQKMCKNEKYACKNETNFDMFLQFWHCFIGIFAILTSEYERAHDFALKTPRPVLYDDFFRPLIRRKSF